MTTPRSTGGLTVGSVELEFVDAVIESPMCRPYASEAVADIVNNLSWRSARCGPTLKT